MLFEEEAVLERQQAFKHCCKLLVAWDLKVDLAGPLKVPLRSLGRSVLECPLVCRHAEP